MAEKAQAKERHFYQEATRALPECIALAVLRGITGARARICSMMNKEDFYDAAAISQAKLDN